MKKIILYLFSYTLSQEIHLQEINREKENVIMTGLLPQNVNSWVSNHIGQLAHSEWINGSDIQSIQDKCLYRFDRMISHKKQNSYRLEPSSSYPTLLTLFIREIEYSASSNENACPPQICTAEVIEKAWQLEFNVTSVECLPKKVETYDIPKESVSNDSSNVFQTINFRNYDLRGINRIYRLRRKKMRSKDFDEFLRLD